MDQSAHIVPGRCALVRSEQVVFAQRFTAPRLAGLAVAWLSDCRASVRRAAQNC